MTRPRREPRTTTGGDDLGQLAADVTPIRFTNTGSFARYTTVVGNDVYLPAGNVTVPADLRRATA